MAFEIHNAAPIGLALIVIELLFWLFVGFGILKMRKNRKNKWKSPFNTQK